MLLLIAEFDRREAWGHEGVKSCAHWLNWKCGLSLGAAREHLRAAKALEELPKVRESFARGEISYSKIRALTRVATPGSESELMNITLHGAALAHPCARGISASLHVAAHLELLVRSFRRVERLEDETKNANKTHAERYLHYYHDEDGSLVISARLPAEQGEALIKSIEAARKVIREERKNVPAGTFSVVTSHYEADIPEPFAAERADALSLVAEAFQAGDVVTRNGGERCQVVVHVDEQVLQEPGSAGRCECEAGPAIAAQTARRLACDAALVRVVEDENGEPLSVGRKTRSIPPALRRALQLRDRHCRFPGCTSRHFLDAHHLKHWAEGGETKVDNLALLCYHHHRLVHEGGFRMVLESNGALSFMTPKGNRIQDYPEPVRSVKPLEILNQQQELDISHETSIPIWHGERMDLNMAVSGLYELSHRDPG